MAIPGIGPLIASAMIAAIGDGAAFIKGRNFAAWLGLVPKQISTGDRTILGGVSRRGNRYLRISRGRDGCFSNCRTSVSLNHGQWSGFRLPGLMSSGIRFLVFGAGQVGRGFSFSHAIALKVDAVSVVDDPVEDSVGDRGFADHVVPLRDG